MAICDYYLEREHSGSEPIGNLISGAQIVAAAEWQVAIETFCPNSDDLVMMPSGAWLLRIDFALKKPYTSKAGVEFRPSHGGHDVIQNAIVRDRLTALPIVHPTTWKGHLAFAARMEGIEGVERLFGSAAGETGEAGRLHFFPTFFHTELAHEVVTPLSRDTRTPTRGAIKFEVIKAGSDGRFHLLYVPRPLPCTASKVADDLECSISAVKSMLLNYGFSAKKTSGWGITNDEANGRLVGLGDIWPQLGAKSKPAFVEPSDIQLKFMDESGAADSRLIKASGEWLSNPEFKNAGTGIGSLSEYKLFRRWYDDHGAEWNRRKRGGAKSSGRILREYPFATIFELADLSVRISAELRKTPNA